MCSDIQQSPRSRGKIIILSAPSGSGKSTIISRLMQDPDLNLGFSISATSRPPRGQEVNGREYYFISADEFRQRADRGEFVEWEEVYPGTCYGTLASEVDRVCSDGRNLVMDIDVKGGINVKKRFGAEAIALFIMPPSAAELEKRLRGRGTDPEESIAKRLAKAEYEMTFAGSYDTTIINDDLEEAVERTRRAITEFLAR